jgi:MFS family permease
MDSKIEKLMSLSGNENKYQYFVLIITFCIWTNICILPVSLAFLEREPDVNFKNPENNITVYGSTLNYTMCEYGEHSYNITQTYSYSWVIEYKITCDRVLTGLLGSMMFTGDMLGSIIMKFFADKIGRRKTILFGLVFTTLALFGITFSQNITQILIFCVPIGLFGTFTALASYMLLTEVVSSRKRAMFGSITNTAFSASGIFFILLYKYLDNWRYIFYVASFFTFISTFLFYYFIKESPRYNFSKHRFDKFMKNLREIARTNNRLEEFNSKITEEGEYKQLVEEIKIHIETCRYNHLNQDKKVVLSTDVQNNCEFESTDLKNTDELTILEQSSEKLFQSKIKKNSPLALVKYSSIRYKFLILCFLWFCISGNYYGLSILLKTLPNDIYFNGIMIYIFEAVAYFCAGFIVDIKYIGRKGFVAFFYTIAIVGFTTLSIFKNLSDNYIVAITFISRFAVSGIFNVLYTYSVEVYPTSVRALGFGINSLSARIAGMIFPILIELFLEYINLVFILMNVLSFIFMLFMPETNGRSLQEHLDEDMPPHII